jgi:hypothetical protein
VSHTERGPGPMPTPGTATNFTAAESNPQLTVESSDATHELDLAAELDQLWVEQREAWRERRDRRHAERAERQARRDAGLRARHAAKLARNRGDGAA